MCIAVDTWQVSALEGAKLLWTCALAQLELKSHLTNKVGTSFYYENKPVYVCEDVL